MSLKHTPAEDFPLGLSPNALVALADYANVGIWNWHIPTNEIRLNEPIVKLTGYEMFEVPHSADSRRRMTFEDDLPLVEANVKACIEGQQDQYQIVYRLNRKDGSLVSVYESAFVYERDADGRAVRLAAMVLDLSDLMHARQKVQSLERENRALCEGLSKDEMATQVHMLKAVNAATAGIVGGFYQDYQTVLFQALQTIGESFGADCLHIYRNTEEKENSTFYLRASWRTGQTMPLAPDEEALWHYDALLPSWRDDLQKGQTLFFTGADIPSALRTLPDAEQAQGMMLIPLILHGAFWGVLRADTWEDGHRFTESEAEIVMAGTIIIASSIARNETLGKLNEAREEAMASTKAKSEFLSRMSHEIRTPINAIIGMTTIARKAESMDRVQYALGKVDASSKQLLAIINDVLDMSKIDSGKFEIEAAPFDFDRMVQNVLNVVQVKLDEKHLKLHLELDSVFDRLVIGDELRISQVLINLFSNAAKFTPDDGRVTLRVRHQPLDGDRFRLHVEVSDTGVGISKESQAKLFTSFEQADGSISRKYGGTGLGLAISKRIVNLMNGDIWVESEPEQGSTFLFEIDAAWGDELPHLQQEDNAIGQMRILVADDASDVREYFTSVLEGFSQICETVSNGKEAIEKVRQRKAEGTPFDLCFIDWNMPGMNGGATAQAIREISGEEILVVMISVADWNDIEPEAKEFGIHNFLPKPVLPSTLYNSIHALARNNMVRPVSSSGDEIHNWQSKTILLAEDIDINREIMFSLLGETGVTLVPAENGQKALDIFTAEPDRFDLILMDVQMPIMDGLSATRAIRALPQRKAKEIPILAMTANAFKEDQQMSMEAGMNGHLSKPIEISALYRELSHYLDR